MNPKHMAKQAAKTDAYKAEVLAAEKDFREYVLRRTAQVAAVVVMRGKGDVIPLAEIVRKSQEEAIDEWFADDENERWRNRRPQWAIRTNAMVLERDVHGAVHARLKAQQREKSESCCFCGRLF